MAELARARIRVIGVVQGVWFRQSTVDEARRLGLRGSVRNLSDGSVEAEAEGERPSVDQLIRWCHRGPPSARVDAVEVEWVAHRGDLGTFHIGH